MHIKIHGSVNLQKRTCQELDSRVQRKEELKNEK